MSRELRAWLEQSWKRGELCCLEMKPSKSKGKVVDLSWKLVHFKYGVVLFCNLPKNLLMPLIYYRL